MIISDQKRIWPYPPVSEPYPIFFYFLKIPDTSFSYRTRIGRVSGAYRYSIRVRYGYGEKFEVSVLHRFSSIFFLGRARRKRNSDRTLGWCRLLLRPKDENTFSNGASHAFGSNLFRFLFFIIFKKFIALNSKYCYLI